MKLTVTISKTAPNSEQDYMQILSDDFAVNIVLIADEIKLVDARTPDDPEEDDT